MVEMVRQVSKLLQKISLITILILALVVFLVVFQAGFSSSQIDLAEQARWVKHVDVLKNIYREISELKTTRDEEFLKREFHIELDGRDSNREEHIVVLIHTFGNRQRMILQITYFRPTKNDSTVKRADEIRIILCSVKEAELVIEECDYLEKELRPLLPKVLAGIKSKKELLKLITIKR
jgi:hypothetical protein